MSAEKKSTLATTHWHTWHYL